LAQIYTVSLHSFYTAENFHIIHNETNGMRKLCHSLRMTAFNIERINDSGHQRLQAGFGLADAG
jgi:hypothetical protein